ncbi:hypothetical protein HR060_09090 [Catenovulum sp. SM1970]|uniref:ATP-grasp domain-containing protein n=1 Tax=Marinifaba aquimaris TaxID=2741323 RepID=UPI001571F17B|nr:hypothetical protein [Marinifaba aquimaris]NTS77026.1 hypothetical protein [Marinifaba aquimaris]
MTTTKNKALPKLGFLYLDYVMRFFDKSNFKGWPNKIEQVTYHWGNDKQRFINEVKRKKIDVLIGNIPATAYETFRKIARELPGVQFLPSIDAQFCNKSKENVTHFCKKYNLPIPRTEIFYEFADARNYLAKTHYPKIIKKSYGPSNYGGYYVHKVDNFKDAVNLLSHKKYYPVYVQDFVPMQADIRVMLIGHKPVCAFWRRPPEGEWLTNTSQGGSMDYKNVPKRALDIAVKASKAANAEYWACDIALGTDGKYRILECATAFAAFPYIRDWIGQFIMWKVSNGQFPLPHIPLYNWEELGKIDSNLLRTMRHITFSRPVNNQPQCDDVADMFNQVTPQNIPLINTENRFDEEWPSEIWDRQSVLKSTSSLFPKVKVENAETPAEKEQELPYTEQELVEFLSSVKGLGQVTVQLIIDTLGLERLIKALDDEPTILLEVKSIKEKKVDAIIEHWQAIQQSV